MVSRISHKDNHLIAMNRFIDLARVKMAGNAAQLAEIDKLVAAANAQDEAFFEQLTEDLGWEAGAQQIAKYINDKTGAVAKP